MMYKLVVFLILVSLSAKAQKPELKGGLSAFVKNNTVYPPYSLYNCIQGTVQVGFKLNTNGEIYYSTITAGIGTDLDDEAVRLIRMSSRKWIMPNNHDTTALLIVPINFSLSGYDCDRMSKADIANAIKAYKNEQELTKVVTNFYQNKENGTFKPEDEVKITQIKNQLGIDDGYLDERVSTGLKKIKQGDRQGACEDFNFVKYMGSDKANNWLTKYCK